MKKNNAIPEYGQIIPGGQHSFWIDTSLATDFPSLDRGLKMDVVIIGGGIAGITAASILKDAGKSVAVIEAKRIVNGVTGHTTAKVTSLHGLIYRELLERFGEGQARIYAESNQSAIDLIESVVAQKDISCDFIRTPMFVYTELEENIGSIKREATAAEKLGLPASYTEDTPLPFKVKGAVRLENQAQFHPRRYLLALADAINGDGSYIFENTRALDIKEGDEFNTVVTDRGEISATNVIIASHFPFLDTGLFFARAYPYQAYALGVYIKGEVPEGMYFTGEQNEFAIRNQPTEDGPILVISGRTHKVGLGGDTLEQYRKLVKHTSERFDIESIKYFWSTEDYDTSDRVPYIGKAPALKRVYVATGFGGWGMTQGTLSGMIISDLILGRENPWAPLYNPSRLNVPVSARSIATENANVLKQYGKGLLIRSKPGNPANLQNGEGRKLVFKHREVAAYKDDRGELHLLSPVCKHMACIVNWNNAEKTWDCPCHGSRYDHDGNVIHGPAQTGLTEMEFGEGPSD